MSESASMLDDNLYINNINPFWEEPPGARSKPYLFNPSVKNTIEQEPEPDEVNTVWVGGVEQRCPLGRPLYPKRYIEGEELIIAPPSPVVTNTPMFQVALGQTDVVFVGIVLVIIFLLGNMD